MMSNRVAARALTLLGAMLLAAPLQAQQGLKREAQEEKDIVEIAPQGKAIEKQDEEKSFNITMIHGPEGVIKIWHNGKEISSDRVVRKDGKVVVLDENGKEIIKLDLEPRGSITFPHWNLPEGGSLFLDRIAPREAKPRTAIGVNVTPISPALGAQLELKEDEALLIADVVAGMPADKAGVKQYDVIVSIDGKRPVDSEMLQSMVAQKKPGETLILEVLRAAKPMKIEVGVEEVKGRRVPLLRRIPILSERFKGDLPLDAFEEIEMPDKVMEEFEFDAPDMPKIHLDPELWKQWSQKGVPWTRLKPDEKAEGEAKGEAPQEWKSRLKQLEERLEKLEEMSRKQLKMLDEWLQRKEEKGSGGLIR